MPIIPRYSTIGLKSNGVKSVARKAKSYDKKEIERIFFNFQETQEFLDVSHQTLYKLMEEGLPSHKIGKKRVFLKEDLEKWIKTH